MASAEKARTEALEVRDMLDARPDLFGTPAAPTKLRGWAIRQSPVNLRRYIASVGPRAEGLTGNELDAVNRAMGVTRGPTATVTPGAFRARKGA